MIMKKIALITVLLTASIAAFSQVTYNAKAGLGIAFMSATDLPDGMNINSNVVWKIGAGIEKAFTPDFSIMPSIELAKKGMTLSATSEGETESEKIGITYLQIPVLGAYRYNLSEGWNVTAKAGPYFGYALSAKASYNGQKEDFSDNINKFEIGLDFGLELEHHRYCFGFEFERGFTSITDEPEDGDIFNAALYVTIGYKF